MTAAYDPSEVMGRLTTDQCIDVAWAVLEGGDALGLALECAGIDDDPDDGADTVQHPGQCPECGTRWLASIEVLTGLCDHDDTGEPQGYTDMDWDSTRTIGWYCRACDRAIGLPKTVTFD